MKGKRTGRYAMMEQFIADGHRYIFGNPGTSEEGFLDSLGEFPQLEYVLALQESIAVATADGYARAVQRPTLVQLHSGVGLGNGVGMMYQALRGHAPLLVIAGEAGIRYDAMDAQMACDLVAMAKPVTKWATRVVDPGSVLRVLRRAAKIAATPPMGPVFVCLPMDVLDAENDEEVLPTVIPTTRVAPEPEDVARLASLLAQASRPLIIMGDGIAASGAQAALVRVAERLGAEVWGSDHSEINFPMTHPLYRGPLGHMFGEQSYANVRDADAVLIVGTYVFPEVFPRLTSPFAKGARVAHVDLNGYEIAKNHPVEVGLIADPASTLARLSDALDQTMTPAQRQKADERLAKSAGDREARRKKELAADRQAANQVPMRPARFMEELGRRLPPDALVFDEALTCSPDLTRYLPPMQPGQYFQTRGGSLGVGIPGALGLTLANPGKTVFGITGDGGSMYTIQALWTAAHHDIPTKFVVCNNRSYKLLKVNLQQYWRERGIAEREFPGSFSLGGPDLAFHDLARSLGVAATRVERPEQIGPALDEAIHHKGPFLIDLVLTDEVDGHEVHPVCGQ